MIWATPCTTRVVYRKSSNMGGTVHMPLAVPRDSGEDFIDQNGYRMKRRFTLLPLIKAVQTTATRKKATSRFDWSSVDFVADRNGLRKLVAWANNKSDYWRIDTQLAGGKTVLMNGWPRSQSKPAGDPSPTVSISRKLARIPLLVVKVGPATIVSSPTYVFHTSSNAYSGPDRR